MTRDRVEQAWTQGFEAANRLLPSSSNSYKPGSDLHEAWFDGWCNGNEPDQEEMEKSELSPKKAARPSLSDA